MSLNKKKLIYMSIVIFAVSLGVLAANSNFNPLNASQGCVYLGGSESSAESTSAVKRRPQPQPSPQPRPQTKPSPGPSAPVGSAARIKQRTAAEVGPEIDGWEGLKWGSGADRVRSELGAPDYDHWQFMRKYQREWGWNFPEKVDEFWAYEGHRKHFMGSDDKGHLMVGFVKDDQERLRLAWVYEYWGTNDKQFHFFKETFPRILREWYGAPLHGWKGIGSDVYKTPNNPSNRYAMEWADQYGFAWLVSDRDHRYSGYRNWFAVTHQSAMIHNPSDAQWVVEPGQNDSSQGRSSLRDRSDARRVRAGSNNKKPEKKVESPAGSASQVGPEINGWEDLKWGSGADRVRSELGAPDYDHWQFMRKYQREWGWNFPENIDEFWAYEGHRKHFMDSDDKGHLMVGFVKDDQERLRLAWVYEYWGTNDKQFHFFKETFPRILREWYGAPLHGWKGIGSDVYKTPNNPSNRYAMEWADQYGFAWLVSDRDHRYSGYRNWFAVTHQSAMIHNPSESQWVVEPQ